MQTKTQRQPLTWDELEVGMLTGPLEHKIGREMLDGWFSALDIGEGEPDVLPVTLLATDYVLLLHQRLHLGFGLMSRHRTRSHRSVRVGETVSVTGVITDKYVRKDRHYWTMCYDVRDRDGALCVDYLVTCTVD